MTTDTTPRLITTFRIDKARSDEEYLFVDVEGIATICIKCDDEGIAVDIYPLHAAGDPVASTWASYNELTDENIKDAPPD